MEADEGESDGSLPLYFTLLIEKKSKSSFLVQMRKKVEIDEGESEGPLDKPSLFSLQNTAIKVRQCLASMMMFWLK